MITLTIYLLRRLYYHLSVLVIRFRNRSPWNRALIKQVASQEWEQQRIADFALGQQNDPYTPGYWWRLRKPTTGKMGA